MKRLYWLVLDLMGVVGLVFLLLCFLGVWCLVESLAWILVWFAGCFDCKKWKEG